ncbi:MAG: tRNA uridine-5-carboxymethylaminomethyl(34) synthesis GTPase MnmE, partial [Chromatiales bacterium]|nr:tRNA uridine-5-carboxymethylaminomethyl(34) synthesis GTPase MnmE [Chromatiales bacterium]
MGGVGIIRISGKLTQQIAEAVAGKIPPPRQAAFCRFRDPAGEIVDEGIALFFPGPNSFTGEDVLELQGHGGPVVMDLLLQTVLAAGARLAHPGEFSQRAFLNDKLDLAQAEAIADLIESGTSAAARLAL